MIRIILSPFLAVIAVLLIPSIDEVLLFLPLIFALSVSVVNFKKLKTNNPYLGIFLNVVQSYMVFLGLAVVLFFSDEFLQDIDIGIDGSSGWVAIILVTMGGYLAAILLFYFFIFIFNIDNKRFSFFAITICYSLIIVVMQVFSKNEFLQFGVEKFASFLISWIIFMSLAFSLSLNRLELMLALDKKKLNQ